MKKLHFILLSLVFINLTSCKNDLDQPRILKGQMMYNCGVPATNAQFFVKNQNPTMIGNAYFREDFTTDSLGFFEVVFYAKNYGKVRIGPHVLDDIPLPKAGEKFDLGKVYCDFTYKSVLKFNVTKPYTENDTLYYGDGYGNGAITKAIAGPFTSGIIDTVEGIKLGGFDYDYLDGYTTQGTFYIRSNGEILLRGTENGNSVCYVPKMSDACENGAMGEIIYNIR